MEDNTTTNVTVNATVDTIVLNPFYLSVHSVTLDVASVFISLSTILGVSGNTLVVLVHRRIKEKLVTDYMIYYIAVCDIMLLSNMPMYICQLEGYWAIGFPDFLCKLHIFNTNSVSMASYMFCACTAIERHFKVVYSKEIFSPTLVKFIWVPIFVSSYGMGSLAFWAVKNNANGHCSFDFDVPHIPTITYLLVEILAFSSSVVIALCYIRVGIYLVTKMKDLARSSNNDAFARTSKNTIQTTKMLSIVTVVFLFSANAPYFSALIQTFSPASDEPWMSIQLIFSTMFLVNTFFNPFLYMGMSTSFRKRSLAVLRSCCGQKSKYVMSEEISKSNTCDQ